MIARQVRSRRCGAALVMAIVALVICSVICFSMMKTSALRAQRVTVRSAKLQARLLAESGTELAARKLQHNRIYSGETRQLELGDEIGTVQITVESESVTRRRVTVVARYPEKETLRAQVTVATLINLDQATAPQSPNESSPSESTIESGEENK